MCRSHHYMYSINSLVNCTFQSSFNAPYFYSNLCRFFEKYYHFYSIAFGYTDHATLVIILCILAHSVQKQVVSWSMVCWCSLMLPQLHLHLTIQGRYCPELQQEHVFQKHQMSLQDQLLEPLGSVVKLLILNMQRLVRLSKKKLAGKLSNLL